jgi:hypothetical protein
MNFCSRGTPESERIIGRFKLNSAISNGSVYYANQLAMQTTKTLIKSTGF